MRPPATPVSEADARWQGVCARDASLDGAFVYAVRTTGVYCRPSCGSRRPRRDNVVFCDTTAAARAAGFRPCLRCTPDAPSPTERDAKLVAGACRVIEQSDFPPRLEALAHAVGSTPATLRRAFREQTGLTPRAWAEARRAARVHEALDASGRVTDALFDAGFASNGRFYAETGRVLGMRPGQWKAGGKDATIRFAVGQCSLGAILVAATPRGLCAVLLGDEADALVRDLQDRFPRAELIGGDADFEHTVATVVGFVETPRLGLTLPLDLRGTAFQLRVWQALRDVPAGTTTSYSELARRIGAPTAARAVAAAVAANPLAVAIPCHRVLRLDGSLSGYRWGVDRKRALLAREADAPAP